MAELFYSIVGEFLAGLDLTVGFRVKKSVFVAVMCLTGI